MRIILDGREKIIKRRGTIAKLLKKLNIRREEAVVKVNGKLAPETLELDGKDKVEILRIAYGG